MTVVEEVEELGHPGHMEKGNAMMNAIKAHPWLSATTAVCALGGMILAYLYGPEGWGHGRKIAAGVFSGVGVSLTIITTRMVGAFSEDDEA